MSVNKYGSLNLSAILEKIEVAGELEREKPQTLYYYFVRIFVAGNEVAKSTRKPRSTPIKWEWDGEKKFQFTGKPLSSVKIVLYRRFEAVRITDIIVGQFEGKVADLLNTDGPQASSLNLVDKAGISVPVKLKIVFSGLSISGSHIKEFMEEIQAHAHSALHLPPTSNTMSFVDAASTFRPALQLTPQNETDIGISSKSLISLSKPFLEATTYWIAAEQALKHARRQTPAISAVFEQYNIGESKYLVQAGFDESLIQSGVGYLEQIHVFVSADIVVGEEIIPNLAAELGRIFSPFSSILFTETSQHHLPVFNDTGAIREFDELVSSTASNIYDTLSAAKSTLTVVSLSPVAYSSNSSSSSQGKTSGGGEESNKDSEGKKTPDKGEKRDGRKESEKGKDTPDPNDARPPGSQKPGVERKPTDQSLRREIWFNVTSTIMAPNGMPGPVGLQNAAFQTLVMDGTLFIVEDQSQQNDSPRRHAHFEALSFGTRTLIPGNTYKQMHIRIVVDSHHKNTRASKIRPSKTSATDGKVIHTIGSQEGRTRAVALSATASPLPSGTVSINLGNSDTATTSSQITQNTSLITEYHNEGIIDWGYDINDSNFQKTAIDIDETLLPAVDFEFFGENPEFPERMDFVVASHWSMILPTGEQEGTQQSKQNGIQKFISHARSSINFEPAQSVSYSNLLHIVALKTSPSKLPKKYGYRATVDVQSRPHQDLEPPEAPIVHLNHPAVDPTIVDVTPATFDELAHPTARAAAVNFSMFGAKLELSDNCIKRLDGLCTSNK